MSKIKLGSEVREKITGFKGIVTAHCEYLTGCDRYCVQPTELLNGAPQDSIYFDEGQLEVVGVGIAPETVQTKEKGACAPNPTSKDKF